MDIFKILAISLLTLVISLVLKNYKREDFAMIAIVLGTVILFGFVIIKIDGVVTLLNDLVNKAGIKTEYLMILLKVMGISYLVEIVKNICQDAGSSSLATKVEMAGKVSIVVLTIPLISSVISVILEMF